MSIPGRSPSDVSRRALVRTTAWSVPVVALAAPAPGFAVSPTTWTITSASYEGTAAGDRNNAATCQMRFTITVPSGVTVTAPMATFNSAPLLPSGGNGVRISGVDPTGTVDGWSVTGSGNLLASVGAYRIFTFTRGDITGPATVTLTVTMTEVADFDIGAAGRPFTFSSSSPTTGPTTTFTVLQANVDSYITTPHV